MAQYSYVKELQDLSPAADSAGPSTPSSHRAKATPLASILAGVSPPRGMPPTRGAASGTPPGSRRRRDGLWNAAKRFMENRGRELVDGAPAPPALGHHASGNPLAGLEDPPSWVEDDRALGKEKDAGDEAVPSPQPAATRGKGGRAGAADAPAGRGGAAPGQSPTKGKARTTRSGVTASPEATTGASAQPPDDAPKSPGRAAAQPALEAGPAPSDVGLIRAIKTRGKGGPRGAPRSRTNESTPDLASPISAASESDVAGAQTPRARRASSASPMRDDDEDDDGQEEMERDDDAATTAHDSPSGRRADGRAATRLPGSSPATPAPPRDAAKDGASEAEEERQRAGGPRAHGVASVTPKPSPSSARGGTGSASGGSPAGGRTRAKARGVAPSKSPMSPARTRASASPRGDKHAGKPRAADDGDADGEGTSAVEGPAGEAGASLEKDARAEASPDGERAPAPAPAANAPSPRLRSGRGKNGPRAKGEPRVASPAHAAPGAPVPEASATASPDAALLGSWAFLKDPFGTSRVNQEQDALASQMQDPGSTPSGCAGAETALPSPLVPAGPTSAPSPPRGDHTSPHHPSSNLAPPALARQSSAQSHSSLQSQPSFSLQPPGLAHHQVPSFPPMPSAPRAAAPPQGGVWGGGRPAPPWMPFQGAPPPPHGPYGPPPHPGQFGPRGAASRGAAPPASDGPLDAEWIERARQALEATARPFPEDEDPDLPEGGARGEAAPPSADAIGQDGGGAAGRHDGPPPGSGRGGVPGVRGPASGVPRSAPQGSGAAEYPPYAPQCVPSHPAVAEGARPAGGKGLPDVARPGPGAASASASRHVSPKRPREDRRSRGLRAGDGDEDGSSEGGREGGREGNGPGGEEEEEEDDDDDDERAEGVGAGSRSGPSARQRLRQRSDDEGSRGPAAFPACPRGGVARSLYPPEESFPLGAAVRGAGKVGRMQHTRQMQALSHADVPNGGFAAEAPGEPGAFAPSHALSPFADPSFAGGSFAAGSSVASARAVGSAHPLGIPLAHGPPHPLGAPPHHGPPYPLGVPYPFGPPHPLASHHQLAPPFASFVAPDGADRFATQGGIAAAPAAAPQSGTPPACLSDPFVDPTSGRIRSKGAGARPAPGFDAFEPPHRGMGHANGISSDLMGGFGGALGAGYPSGALAGLPHAPDPALPPAGAFRSSSTPPLRSPLAGLLTPTPGCLGLLAANTLGLPSPGSARDLAALLPPGTTTPEASALALASPAARLLLTPGRHLDGLLGSPDMRGCEASPASGALFRAVGGDDGVDDDDDAWGAGEA